MKANFYPILLILTLEDFPITVVLHYVKFNKG
jgi:hypothetical protein